MQANAPIGIFDSGIGGLTVAALIYFGDTAHFPYGDKSPSRIEAYGLGIADYLLSQGCKMIVIACNTASAHAFKAVTKHVGNKAIVVNVIDPASQVVANRYPNGRVGVIATRGTIQSGIYPRKIKKISPNTEVTSLATPLLAPMIEEGFFNNRISRTVIHSYLEKKSLQNIQAIILGCTHYPLIHKEIEEYYQGKVDVVDSAEMVAISVKEALINKHLLSTNNENGELRFLVSDFTESFETSAAYFFPEKVQLEECDIWK
jgi:glutamate racemase